MTNPSKIIATAKAEVGYQEKRAGGHWVNDSKFTRWYGTIPGYSQGGYGYPWCAVFVAWCAAQAGVAALVPKTAGCATAVNWYKARKRFSEYPAIGAQIFFGSGGGAHTGLVYDYDATHVYTVEGNTNTAGGAEGDGVYLKKRLRRDSYVYGYGYPAYSEGIKSADPAWAAQAPAAPTKPAAPAKPVMPAFPGRQYFVKGAKSKHAKTLQGWLHSGNWGPKYKVGPSETMTQMDLDKVAALQRHWLSKLGPADGLCGPLTWQYAWEVATGQRKK